MAPPKKEKQGTDKEKKTAVAPVAAELPQEKKPKSYYVGLLCDVIATTDKGLHRLIPEFKQDIPDFPSVTTLLTWIADDAEFTERYARAREAQADILADQIIEISDDSAADYTIMEDGKRVLNSEHVQRSRLRVDSRKWIASKLKPKKYGDKISSEVEVSGTLSVVSLSKEDTAL